MAELRIGPPFDGLSDDRTESGLSVPICSGLIPSRGSIVVPPMCDDLELNKVANQQRFADLGLYVYGTGDDAIVITIGTSIQTSYFTDVLGTNHSYTVGDVVYIATKGKQSCVRSLNREFGEVAPEARLYSFRSMGRKIYFGGGTHVYRVDIQTMIPEVMEFTTGIESQSRAYITGKLPIGHIGRFNDRMVYTLKESADMQTSIEPDVDDPLLDDSAKINTDGTVHYGREQILFSDPFAPDAIQWLMALDIEDDGAAVVGTCPWQSSLLVFTNKGLWILQGDNPSNYVLSQWSRYADCASAESITPIGDEVYWVGRNAAWKIGEGGVQRIHALDCLFRKHDDNNTASKIRQIVPCMGFASNSTGSANQFIPTETDSVDVKTACGAPYQSGRYWVVAMRGQQFLPAYEIETGKVGSISTYLSWSAQSQLTIFDCDPSGVADGGLLVGSGAFHSLMHISADGALSDASYMYKKYGFRLPYSEKKMVISEIIVVLSEFPTTLTATVYPLEEMVRYAGSETPSAPEDLIIVGTATLPPGEDEEATEWATAGATTGDKWQDASPPSGTKKPRWIADLPVEVRIPMAARARDALIVLSMLTPGRAAIEAMRVVYELDSE